MKRREFTSLLGAALTGWSFATHAQQGERMRRIGLLMLQDEDDPSTRPRLAAFVEELQKSNWVTNRNIQIDIRWGAADNKRSRKHAAEMVALAPDVIVATASA